MPTIYRRGDSRYWWADIKKPDGGRLRKSAGTTSKQDAEAWARELEADLWKQARLGVKPSRLWEEAVLRWLRERAGKKSIRDDRAKFRWLDPYLRGKKLTEITRALVLDIANAKAGEASPATANRHTALISAVLNRAAKDWGWVDNAPKFHKFKERDRRVRFLTPDEAGRLLEALPDHQRDMVLFALATGLRQSNVKRLSWPQVDIERRVAWIYADQAKGGSAISVPLNGTAMAVLQKCAGAHPERVFTYRGRPVSEVNTRAWRKALERAGIENFRWHDLRHTFASHLAMSGASLLEIQELGGWKNSEMVRRYAHLSADHLQEASSKLDTFLARSLAVA